MSTARSELRSKLGSGLYSGTSSLGTSGGARELNHSSLDGVLMRVRDKVIGELVRQSEASGAEEESLQNFDPSVIVAAVKLEIDAISEIDEQSRPVAIQFVVDEILGNGPIQSLLQDPSVTEVMVNRFDRVFCERNGRLEETPVKFSSETHLRGTIERIVARVGRRIDESSPTVDARLPDGSRVNAVVPPIALDGSSLTIRKFSVDKMTLQDLLDGGTLTPESAEYLRCAMEGKANIVVSGGTGSGKTTTLNVVSSLIPDDQRIVTLEDSAELQLNKPHVVRLESRPANVEGRGAISIRDLVKNSLRMRPDRIIVGEIRDGTAFDMLQAMNTGHEGSMTTVHANSPSDALLRLESMCLMAGLDLPTSVIRQQIASAVDVILQQTRLIDGRRRITQIAEISPGEDGEIAVRTIFRFKYDDSDQPDKSTEKLVWTGQKSSMAEKFSANGSELPEYLR